MLKKFLIGTFVAIALLVGVTASAAYDFGPSTLKVGSKGEYVKAVQTLVGATVDGVFGPMTAAKVKAWQASNGLEADGLFGAMSKAKANAGTSTVAGCPAGALFNSLTGAPCTTVVVSTVPGCTAGALFSSTTGQSCTTGTVMTGNTDGSITAGTSSYVSSGITIKKGETKDVAAVRLQAIAGPVKLSYVDVEFNVRPWLFFGQLSLHDSNGNVIATKALTSAADSTEITVGSDYQVRFDNLSYVVRPGTNVDLAVSASVLPATDKIPSGGQSVTAGITSMRTISEAGYSNTVSFASIPNSTNVNTVTLTSTGSVASIYTRISPASPSAGQQVVSLTQTTSDVTLGAFSLKSTNDSSTLNTFKVALTGTAANFSNYRLFVNGSSVAGGTISSSTITFSNMNVPLSLDTWTDVVIKADIKADPTLDADVHLTLTSDTTNVVVTDANYGTPTVNAGTRTSNAITLTVNSVAVSGTSATLGSSIVQSNVTTGYNATYALTLTNNSNNDLYVSSTPSTFVTMVTTGSTGTTTGTALSSITASPSTVNGDDTYNYAIPAGQSRTFTFPSVLKGDGTTIFKATALNYSATAYTGTTTNTGPNVGGVD